MALAERHGCVAPVEFLRDFVRSQRPVVMRAAAAAQPAATRWAHDSHLARGAAEWVRHKFDSIMPLRDYLARYPHDAVVSPFPSSHPCAQVCRDNRLHV